MIPLAADVIAMPRTPEAVLHRVGFAADRRHSWKLRARPGGIHASFPLRPTLQSLTPGILPIRILAARKNKFHSSSVRNAACERALKQLPAL
jgi:hypothetical protein